MNREEFKQKLITHCKNCYLKVSNDENRIFLSLNLSYDVFTFYGKDYFELNDNIQLYPAKPLVKCYDFSTQSLLNCMRIATYWAEWVKQRKINRKLSKILQDF